MSAKFGEILFDLVMGAGQSVRRNSADNGWEAFDPLLSIYPIGSIYLSVVSTNPGTLFGGTWSAFGAGRVLVGLDAGQSEFDTVEETGGAKTVASSGTVSTIAQTETAGTSVQLVGSDVASIAHTHPAPTYTGSATSVLQPYIVVYMFKRTA